MNKHDSERLAGLLVGLGYEPAEKLAEANLVIFNTCCVRKHADDRLYGNVAALKQWKASRSDTILAVGGCLAQKYGEKLLLELPHVDIVFGAHNQAKLPDFLQAARRKLKVCDVSSDGNDFLADIPAVRERSHHAWIPITVGCDNFCSYCIVPYVRGRERSRKKEDILAELRLLAADGVVEVTLLGQNVNSYGRDLYGKPIFAELLADAAEIGGLKRIRFTTSHPKDLSRQTIDVVAASNNICSHIHLPVQAGSNRILKAMWRGYTREEYLELVKEIYKKIPSVSITSDIMVGFPGETEEDFENTLDLVRRVEFDQAFTFIYSARPGTEAAKLPNQIPYEIKSARFKRLVELQNSIGLNKNRSLVGKDISVFVEGYSRKGRYNLAARTDGHKLVHFQGSENLINSFAGVRIVDAYSWFLIGEKINQ